MKLHTEGLMATTQQITPAPKLKIEKIAVLTDFSKGADAALEYAATFARAYDASIVLVHAYVPPTAAWAAPEMILVYETLDEVRQSLEDRLHNLTKASFLHGIHCTTMLRVGGTQDLLDAVSDADLVVVGTAGGSGLEKAALGSTAEAIFRSSTIPVLTVGPHCPCNGKAAVAIKTILYATDFSSGAGIALAYATSIAREQQAELILLHVKDDEGVPFTFERTMASAEPLEKLQKLSPEKGLPSRPLCTVRFGAPDKIILEEAKKHDANLIVMGARGAGALAGLISHFGGGTAYKVAANATCPVLTIRKSNK
jgi:nucleotide-binding universal stress UspA family protein